MCDNRMNLEFELFCENIRFLDAHELKELLGSEKARLRGIKSLALKSECIKQEWIIKRILKLEECIKFFESVLMPKRG